MPQRVADLCRSIQEEYDPKKLSALTEELIRVLDEDRAIKARSDFPLDASHSRHSSSESVHH
jgi:hypothetical protein